MGDNPRAFNPQIIFPYRRTIAYTKTISVKHTCLCLTKDAAHQTKSLFYWYLMAKWKKKTEIDQLDE